MVQSTILAHALAFLELGIPVFPCNPANKKPCTDHGFKDASLDPQTIDAWWEANPDAMIGLPTGEASGLFVLDVDVDPERGLDGEASLAALVAGHAPLPETAMARTPRGGRHLYFRFPASCRVRNSASKLGVGLDIRAEGGYVIAPPSVNAEGKAYRWNPGPDETAPADAPDWLFDLITANREKAGPKGAKAQAGGPAEALLHREVEALAAIASGGRNDALNKAAFKLAILVVVGAASEEEVTTALVGACEHNGLLADDGDRAVTGTIASGLSAGKAAFPDIDVMLAEAETEPNVVFDHDNLVVLAELAKYNPRRYQEVRAKLKALGVPLGSLEKNMKEASRPEPAGGTDRSQTQAAQLIELVADAELHHTNDKTAYADVMVNGHRETMAVRSTAFRELLLHRFYTATRGAPDNTAVQSALNTIEARAKFDGPEREVHLRVAPCGDRVYIDLGDELWRAAEIRPDGWSVLATPPVRFRREPGMLPLPMPEAGGTVEALRQFLNISHERDFMLIVVWILAALRGRGPFVVLVIVGEHGTAKSQLVRFLRDLIDPYKPPLRSLPKGEQDLFITAKNAYVIVLDNLSSIPGWLSDALCRLSTGGGFATRQLYTTSDEMLFEATRPILLNGIGNVVSRGDLDDRSLVVTLQPIPDTGRRPKQQIEAEFDAERGRILGALFDALAHGLKNEPDVQVDSLPRMADFAKFGVACETAFGPPGTFMAAFESSRHEAVQEIIDGEPVATGVRLLMERQPRWEDTATKLLGRLSALLPEEVVRAKSWPTNPKALSDHLRRCAPSLRKIGIDVSFTRKGKGSQRMVTLTKAGPGGGKASSSASPSSAPSGTPSDPPHSGNSTADAGADATDDACVSPDTKEDQDGDEADAEDAEPAPATRRRKKGQRGFDYRGSERVQDWHDSGRAAKWSCRDEAETEDEDQTTDQ